MHVCKYIHTHIYVYTHICMNMPVIFKYIYLQSRSQSPHISNTLLNVSTKIFHRDLKLSMHRIHFFFLTTKPAHFLGSQLQ